MHNTLTAQRSKTRTSVLLLAILFLLVTNLVFIRLALQTPPHERYTGMGLEAVSDKLVYYAMIQQGYSGKLFMRNPHTTEPQADSLFSPQWFVIGQASKLFSVPVEISYHAARVILTVLFLWLIWLITARIFTNTFEQLLAYAAVLFSSGIGWLYYVAHPAIADTSINWLVRLRMVPADLYVTELAPMTAFMQSPLFMLSYILLLVVWYLLVEGMRIRSWWVDASLFGSGLFLTLLHPYDAVVACITGVSYAVFVLWRSGDMRTVRRAAVLIGGVLGAVGYHFSVLVRETAVSGWLSQNLAFSPPVASYLWGIGILFPFALLGIIVFVKRNESRLWWILIFVWSLSVVISIYLPFNVNRRFANAWLVPIAFLASYGLVYLFGCIRPVLAKLFIGMSVALIAFSGTVYHLAQAALYVPSAAEHYAYYLNSPLQDALAYSASHSSSSSRILSNEEFIAMLFGAYSTATLYLGHPDQTIRYPLKKEQNEWLFGVTATDEAADRKRFFVRTAGIFYMVLYKPALKNSLEWLTPIAVPVFENELIRIYKLTDTNS